MFIFTVGVVFFCFNSSLLLQDIPRHDARLFEVREAFKRKLLLGSRAYISAYSKGPSVVAAAAVMPLYLLAQTELATVFFFGGW